MTTKKCQILTSGIIILMLIILFIIDATQYNIIYYYGKVEPDVFHFISTILCTLVYFPIFYLYIKLLWAQKWKRLITALFSAAVIVILIVQFIFHLLQWYIVSRLFLEIDVVITAVFLLLNFMQDINYTILVVIYPTMLGWLFTPLVMFTFTNYRDIIIIVLLAGSYFILVRLYVKHILKRWEKAVTIVTILVFIFATAILIFFILHFYLDGLSTNLYYVLISVHAILTIVLWVWIYVRKANEWREFYIEQEVLQTDQYNFLERAGIPTRFTVLELNTATGNFETPIGMGGSGAVFKGVMGDGSIVAVKRIKGQSSGEQEFRTEITIIASLQHVNLVRLLGYCLSPRGDRYLIYPFFENGSLDSWLFAEEEKRSHLTWVMRYNIAIAVAKALAYLHYECHHRILHLDVKPANILLDGDFKALLTDFGISKSIARNQSSVLTRARGTIGYLPPEMLVSNAISPKSDVYSYGMVLLELVGGRKNFQSSVDPETEQRTNSYFPKIAREKMVEGKLMEVVDKSLIEHQDIKEDEVIILVQVALWCIQENLEIRPTMLKVVDMLEGRIPVQMPPESLMFVINFLDVQSQSSASGDSAQVDENASMSVNTISISIQSGR